MKRHSIFLGLLTCMVVTTANPMARQGGFFIPDTFQVQTAFDKLSGGNICQTLTCAAGIYMLYKAGSLWADSSNPFSNKAHQMPTAEQQSQISNGRKQASLRYLITSSAFITAGLLQKYGSKIVSYLPGIFGKLISLKQRFVRS